MQHSDILSLVTTAVIRTQDYALIGRWSIANKYIYSLCKEKLGIGYTKEEFKTMFISGGFDEKINQFTIDFKGKPKTERAVKVLNIFYEFITANLQFFRKFARRSIILATVKLIQISTDDTDIIYPYWIYNGMRKRKNIEILKIFIRDYNKIYDCILRHLEYTEMWDIEDMFDMYESGYDYHQWYTKNNIESELPMDL